MDIQNSLLKNAAIFFLGNVAFGIGASMLRLPAIIGYMVSGVLLGPFAMRYIASQETIDIIHQIGEFGLIVFMFLTGLELDTNKFLKSNIFKHVNFAMLQFGHSTAFVVTILLLPKTFILFIYKNALASSCVIAFIGLIYAIYQRSIEGLILRYSAKLRFVYAFIVLNVVTFISYLKMEKVQLPVGDFIYNAISYVGPVAIVAFITMIVYYALKKKFFNNGQNNNHRATKYISIFFGFISICLLFYFKITHLMNNKFQIAYIVMNYVCPYLVFLSLLVIMYNQYKEQIESFRLSPFTLLFSLLLIFLIGNINQSFLFSLVASDVQIVVLLIALLALNSTAVAIKLLENRDQKENYLGSNIIGVLISQDLMFMAVIIFLKGFKEGVSVWNLSYKLALAGLILHAVNVVCKSKPSFISNFLDYIRKSGLDLMTIFVIAFCCISAFIFDMMGVSDVYGAFVAGLLIGNVYKHRHSMLSLCSPISALLMSIFFLYIGLLINLKTIRLHFGIVILINTIVMLFKYLSNYSISSLLNKDDPEFTPLCITISALILTQMSEFSLLMIDTVLNNIDNASGIVFGMNIADLRNFLDSMKSCSIVSLTFGCLVTVLLKRIVYNRYRNKIKEIENQEAEASHSLSEGKHEEASD